jgi:iron complex outermembrane receptor protein
VVDGSIGWNILLGSATHSITLRIDNALDKEYRDHLSRTKAIMPEPGRSFGLVYRLAF